MDDSRQLVLTYLVHNHDVPEGDWEPYVIRSQSNPALVRGVAVYEHFAVPDIHTGIAQEYSYMPGTYLLDDYLYDPERHLIATKEDHGQITSISMWRAACEHTST